MVIYESYTLENECYTFTSADGDVVLMPAATTILVDDNSGFISIKNTATRKTVGLIRK